jgi:lipopolysaccharide transport system ATP-binding protein
MTFEDISIRVANLGKCYQIYGRPQDRLKQSRVPRLRRLVGRQAPNYFRQLWALRDVSFEVRNGETVGIIRRNGSSKSTLLQIICGTLTPTAGNMETQGRLAALLDVGAGFNPDFSGRENIRPNASLMGLSREEIDERFAEIAAFADIGDFIEQPIKTYSSGM